MSNARYASTMKKNVIGIDFNRVGLGTRTDAAIAKDFGVPRRRVTKERAKRGIPAYTKANPGVTYTPVSTLPKVKQRSAPKTTAKVVAAAEPVAKILASTPISPAPVAQKSVKLKNYVGIVIDSSCSMCHLINEVKNLYRGFVETTREKSKQTDQESIVSVFTFANHVMHDVINVDAEQVNAELYYNPDGRTALWDGVGAAIEYFRAMPDANEPNVSFVVIVITDGYENQSQTFTADRLKGLMRDVQYTDRWSLAFQVPPGGKQALACFGIPTDNIREWEGTKRGVQEASQYTNAAIGNYYVSRASGQTSNKKLFVETDLSKVSTKDVTSKLDDLSHKFRSYSLEKEYVVKDAMEAKTRKPFVIGAVYYELMKTEEIQPQKDILIVERGKKAIWGGDQARQLIGLPCGVSAKVKPGNHSKFKIFVRSTSINRILPRGTEILIDTTQLTDLTPTWDHTQVAK